MQKVTNAHTHTHTNTPEYLTDVYESREKNNSFHSSCEGRGGAISTSLPTTSPAFLPSVNLIFCASLDNWQSHASTASLPPGLLFLMGEVVLNCFGRLFQTHGMGYS